VAGPPPMGCGRFGHPPRIVPRSRAPLGLMLAILALLVLVGGVGGRAAVPAASPAPAGSAEACAGPVPPTIAIPGLAMGILPGDPLYLTGFRVTRNLLRPVLARVRDGAWYLHRAADRGIGMTTAIAAGPDGLPITAGWGNGARIVAMVGRLTLLDGWEPIATPSIPAGVLPLALSVAGDEIVVAGSITTAMGYAPLLLRGSPAGLVRETIRTDGYPLPVSDGALLALARDAVGRPVAVGWEHQGGILRPLIVRRDPTGWHRLTLPDLGDEALLAAIGRADDGALRAGGMVRRGDAYLPLVLDLTGERVSEPSLSDPGEVGAATIIRAVLPPEAGGILAGVTLTADGRGEAWFHPPQAIPRSFVPQGAAAADGTTWIVGRSFGGLQAWLRCGAGGWRPFPPIGSREEVRRPLGAAEPEVAEGGMDDEAPPVPGSPAADPLDRGPWRTRHGILADRAVEAGLDVVSRTWGAVAADLDSDGATDLVIGTHSAPLRVFRNVGGRFAPAPADAATTAPDRHGCAAGNVDGDPLLDLACTVGAFRGTGLRADELWADILGAGPVTDEAAARGVVDPLSRGRRALLLDADGDGDDDLYLVPERDRYDGLPSLSRFLRNDAGRFVRDPGAGLDGWTGAGCALTADLDRDGRPDIVVCRHSLFSGDQGIRISMNTGGRFVEADPGIAFRGFRARSAAIGDFDGDGRPDLAVTDGAIVRTALADADGRLRFAWQVRVPDAIALAAGDADGDGADDLYAIVGGSGDAPDRLFLSRGCGLRSRAIAIPGVPGAGADSVIALDRDGDGRDGFLVLDGRDAPAPVRLIELDPAPGPTTGTRTAPC